MQGHNCLASFDLSVFGGTPNLRSSHGQMKKLDLNAGLKLFSEGI